MKFKTVLTDRGKAVYKGGNKEPLNKMLFSFEAKSNKEAEKIFYKKLIETLGSGSEYLFKVVEV